jgi:hypothetical protein
MRFRGSGVARAESRSRVEVVRPEGSADPIALRDCDDPRQGAFRVHLTSRRKRWLVLDSIADTPELGSANDCVLERLEGWPDTRCRVTRLDERISHVSQHQDSA